MYQHPASEMSAWGFVAVVAWLHRMKMAFYDTVVFMIAKYNDLNFNKVYRLIFNIRPMMMIENMIIHLMWMIIIIISEFHCGRTKNKWTTCCYILPFFLLISTWKYFPINLRIHLNI